MAGLANPPGFGNNSWNEEKWSRAQAMAGARFLVGDSASWKPSVVTTTDRTVALAPGRGYACGVYDETTTTDLAPQLDPNTTGENRYDLIVSRWVWSTKTRVFAVIKGGVAPPQGNSTSVVQAGLVNRIPGVQYDAVIAVVTVRPNVGTLATTDLVDLRVWMAGATLQMASANPVYADVPSGGIINVPATSTQPARQMINSSGQWRRLTTNRIFRPRYFDWPAAGYTAPRIIPGGAAETGYGGFGQQEKFTLDAPTWIDLSCQFRVGTNGAALCYIRVDGVTVSPAAVVRMDHGVTAQATVLLSAGTHTPSLRVEPFGSGVYADWIAFYLSMREGSPE